MNGRLFAPNQKKLEPLNECMYCGKKEGDLIEIIRKKEKITEPVKLSDEHIIPYAFGGTLLLEKSSCQKCASITAKIEQDILKGFLYYPRIIGNLPTRRKKDRPTQIRLACIGKDEKTFQKDFSISEAISVILMPIFEQAGCLEGKNFLPNEIKVKGVDHKFLGTNAEVFIQRNNLKGFKIKTPVEVNAFFRVLAKIAYGYYVAQNGIFPREESPLLPIIFGKNIELEYSAQNFIGSSDESNVEVQNQSLHLIYSNEHRDDKGNIADSVLMQFFVSKHQKDCYAKYQAFVRIRPIVN